MKRIFLLVFITPFIAAAQQKPLIIEGVAPDFYIVHTVAPKENYYSVGRLYNISPRDIAPFNNLELEKGLSLHQVIKVPLLAGNFSQDAAVAADEALVPLYHVVKEKEGLYRISTNYNKLPLETLKKWNHITTDGVGNGTKIIVGYLKVKKELSAFSGQAKQVAPVVSVPAKQTAQPAEVKEAVAKQPIIPPAAKENVPAPTTVKKEIEPVPVKKEEPALVKTADTEKKKAEPVTETRVAKNFGGGYFKNVFTDQARGHELNNETGTAAIFKSTSGWEDGKYYCLHNNAASGSILKITNSSTGKTVYAKVLDLMPDIKQNNGVIIRLSNAAAAELGQADGKFDCTLSYSK